MANPSETVADDGGPPPTQTHKWMGSCTPFALPDNGTLVINDVTVTIAGSVVFTPDCSASNGSLVVPKSGISDIKPPFHASETPQAFATGAATVLAWMLVVMLIITPRTFFVGGVGGGVGLLGRRGIISGAQGQTSIIGVGSRPRLQKVAAISVAISLTIVTADTFRVAERMYNAGFMNIDSLRAEVTNSTQIKVSRMISDIFLWLAQIQTLVRLFPRHKEKVMIKWIGFGLIIFDTTFTCLNSFATASYQHNKTFRKAIPTLSDTFQLALSSMYACWVLYYAIHKRRYAFYHSLMWNVSVVAFLSLLSLATPIIFLIIDIANKSIAGWGDYFRWVGLAAASVIVWEWVERIEALEREEKKDGILGREIFDEDDSDNEDFPNRDGLRRRRGGGPNGHSSALDMLGPEAAERLISRPRPIQLPETERINRTLTFDTMPVPNRGRPIIPPPQTASPISRADTASAASTIYTIQYNTFNLFNPPIQRPANEQDQNKTNLNSNQPRVEGENIEKSPESVEVEDNSDDSIIGAEKELPRDVESQEKAQKQTRSQWFHIPKLFTRGKTQPPPELRQGQVIDPIPLQSATESDVHPSRLNWDLRSRLAPERAVRVTELPITYVPAPPRGGVNRRPWSPDQVERQPPQDESSQVGSLDERISQTVAEATPQQT